MGVVQLFVLGGSGRCGVEERGEKEEASGKTLTLNRLRDSMQADTRTNILSCFAVLHSVVYGESKKTVYSTNEKEILNYRGSNKRRMAG